MKEWVAQFYCLPLIIINYRLRRNKIVPDEWYPPDRFYLEHGNIAVLQDATKKLNREVILQRQAW